ncbi:hypothetical protein ABEG18_07025 [Alsobacter sp. KACC 23698]|uniref:Uncharacterized protein n=1 Tax=Alsobacter sp. KACC 23698 TaxID=3149229 RepID=A0AAU7JKP2_9HYPH
MLAPDHAAALVRAIYVTILKREPDAEGPACASRAVAAGATSAADLAALRALGPGSKNRLRSSGASPRSVAQAGISALMALWIRSAGRRAAGLEREAGRKSWLGSAPVRRLMTSGHDTPIWS